MLVDFRMERELARRAITDRVVTAELERVKGVLDEFNYELKKIDERLELVRVDGDADCAGTNLKPGYYHVVLRLEGAPWSAFPVQDREGGFMEPDSSLFRLLKESDLWVAGNLRRTIEAESKAYEAERRRLERENQARREELAERVDAATRTQVSLNDSSPWAQNMAGVARTKGETQKKRGEVAA